MNLESYTTFYSLSKTKINKFLQGQNWNLGTVITNFKEKGLGDYVSLFDESISNIIQEVIHDLKLPHILVSEENIASVKNVLFDQPLVILDPIDGTTGFIRGRETFALSLSFMDQNILQSSWVWNFGTQEEGMVVNNRLIGPLSTPASNIKRESLIGLISETEYNKKLWPNLKFESLELKSCGSIAYKLLLLAKGECDFVISKRPKNLWDISGGTHLVKVAGFELYEQDLLVKSMNKMEFKAPLLWCRAEDKIKINKILKST